MRLCAAQGCENQHWARGFCGKHYQRWKRTSSSNRPLCAVKGCSSPQWSRGWCSLHYRRWQSTGDPVGLKPQPVRQVCSIDGCDKLSRAHGWCNTHYERWRRTGDATTVQVAKGGTWPDHLKEKLRGRSPWNKGKTMSEETRSKVREARARQVFTPERNRKIGDAHRGKPKSPEFIDKISGSNHYAWKGGRSRPMNRRAWRELRAQIIERDDYTCQECGKASCTLIAHHIIPWPEGPDEASNLITWCRSCHTRYHRLNP